MIGIFVSVSVFLTATDIGSRDPQLDASVAGSHPGFATPPMRRGLKA
jgi:hypothetical protein